MNWVLLDEQFKFVQSGSGAQQVGNDQEFKLHTATSNITKNGYLYVFVSNETPNINTFFDNLQVTHIKGPLLEESHYYPFGTEMSGISSHSLPSYVPNRYKANGSAEYGDCEWSNNTGLEMYETFYRSYNAQIGRFMQGDPKMEATITMSGYVFSGNNPVMFTDLLGDQYKYMDKMGNRWHHADILEGTANEGQQYMEGFGLDGFGDSWIGDVQNGGGGGGKGHGSSQTDYTSQWEEIVAGFNSGKGDSWSPGYGFYDGSLYPAGVNWVRLNEVVVRGIQKSYPLARINYWFSQKAFLGVEGIGWGGRFDIKGSAITRKRSGDKYNLLISMSAWSPARPGHYTGIGGAYLYFFGEVSLYADGNKIAVRKVSSDDILKSPDSYLIDADRTPLPLIFFDLPEKMPVYNLTVGFHITYQYINTNGGSVSPGFSTRTFLDRSLTIYSNLPAQ